MLTEAKLYAHGKLERAQASDVVKELYSQIKELRKDIAKAEIGLAGADERSKEKEIKLRLELDSLYRDRYALKELGNEEVGLLEGRTANWK